MFVGFVSEEVAPQSAPRQRRWKGALSLSRKPKYSRGYTGGKYSSSGGTFAAHPPRRIQDASHPAPASTDVVVLKRAGSLCAVMLLCPVSCFLPLIVPLMQAQTTYRTSAHPADGRSV
ncbi:hypothetical protein NDU88_009548 [Pleurodeles waltl]|uniref:Uncharacterized protein n=1 Tax=Pleurodeles waltl TaxID=8319 RepID=A0AAV7NZE9_PLEWA|nr:hypothetical protein NDU88_009548 [Pleurodeles waltl]